MVKDFIPTGLSDPDRYNHHTILWTCLNCNVDNMSTPSGSSIQCDNGCRTLFCGGCNKQSYIVTHCKLCNVAVVSLGHNPDCGDDECEETGYKFKEVLCSICFNSSLKIWDGDEAMIARIRAANAQQPSTKNVG